MGIRSEVSPLKQVIIHPPGVEHHYTLPENTYEWIQNSDGKLIHNPDYLLFDDLISPNLITNEHNQLSEVLSAFTGIENTIHFMDLIKDIFHQKHNQMELLDECIALDEKVYGIKTKIDTKILMDLDSNELINLLISGRIHKENINTILKWPLPNLIFTRDVAAMIGNTLLITWAKREARKRETLLMNFISKHHPMFEHIKTFDFHTEHPELSIEGGDIIIFDTDTLFIGLSERNSLQSINAILPLCYEEGFHRIVVVDLPKIRTVMHLDTIFSRISNKEVLVYPPLYVNKVMKGYPISIRYLECGQSIFEVESRNESLSDCLLYLGYKMKSIFCGGKEPTFQEREQWSDGANAFALQPGKIISYSRNIETLGQLEQAGYRVVTYEEFLDHSKFWINSDEQLVFSIDSAELPRGRGGPRCLTLPLGRA